MDSLSEWSRNSLCHCLAFESTPRYARTWLNAFRPVTICCTPYPCTANLMVQRAGALHVFHTFSKISQCISTRWQTCPARLASTAQKGVTQARTRLCQPHIKNVAETTFDCPLHRYAPTCISSPSALLCHAQRLSLLISSMQQMYIV